MILMVYFPWPAWAETMYITENQDVLIRGGKGNEFKISWRSKRLMRR